MDKDTEAKDILPMVVALKPRVPTKDVCDPEYFVASNSFVFGGDPYICKPKNPTKDDPLESMIQFDAPTIPHHKECDN